MTGGNRGIGLAICRALALRELAVVLAARDEAEGRRAEAELGADELDVAYYPLDVADPAAIDRCRLLLENDGVEIDVLVNNAEIYTAGDATSVDGTALDIALGGERARSVAAVWSIRSWHAPARLWPHCQHFVRRRGVFGGARA